MTMNFDAIALQPHKKFGEVWSSIFPEEWTRLNNIPDDFNWIDDDPDDYPNPNYKPEYNLNLTNPNCVYVLRDVLGFNGDTENGFHIDINVFINVATKWLQSQIGKQSAEVACSVDAQSGKCLWIEGGRREGYDNNTVGRMVYIAREGRERGATHVGAI